MKELLAKEKENANTMREFAKEIILIGANIEKATYQTIEPNLIFEMCGTRYSLSIQNNNTFGHAQIESSDFRTLIQNKEKDLGVFLTEVFEYLTKARFSSLQSEWFGKFDKYIGTLKKNYTITPVMEQLACDVAWDMTDGWDEMNVSLVADYFIHDESFVKALEFGESEMRRSLDGEIDFNNADEVSDESNEFAFGSVEEEFARLVYDK